ncbi:MAG: hypothetical protein RJA70_2027 [Pseudomonadota bacterium]|jgi:type VI secretion system protein ImpJ
MTEPKSLCRVDWKLGQALMPEHFLWQEDSLRREWELRAGHGSLPLWGLNALKWDEELLAKSGRLLFTQLELVFETGLLVSIPGNASAVSLDLPEDGEGPIDIYLHMDSSPALVKGDFGDQEGNLIELRQQNLLLAMRPLNTPLPAFHLARMRRPAVGSTPGPDKKPLGWEWDLSYVPPLLNIWALRDFAEARYVRLHDLLDRWTKLLRAEALENTLAVNKRVEAQMYLRSAQGLLWSLRQVAPHLDPGLAPRGTHASSAVEGSVRAHPFELYRSAAQLYLDVFSFRASPLQLLRDVNPKPLLYRHARLAECFSELEEELKKELTRPSAGSPEWTFARDSRDGDRWVCELPAGIPEQAELYFLVQFEKTRPGEAGEEREDGLDRRLLGMRLAAPQRLDVVESRALTGIPLERVRLVPFPHNFDTSTLQFYRLKHGEEWLWATKEGKIAYLGGGRPLNKCFLYSPDAVGA